MFSCGSETVTPEQQRLREQVQLSAWPIDAQVDLGTSVVELTPGECDRLGGDVDYHVWCSGTHLKCVVGDRAICIDELDPDIEK